MTRKNKKTGHSSTYISKLNKHLLVTVLKGISLLPFTCIYALSDFLFFMNRYILKYRHDVVRENLKAAFPDKAGEEIVHLSDKFYRHFFDLILESVKLYNMTEKQLNDRISFEGLDSLETVCHERKGAIVLAFHHNNWEWSSYVQNFLKHPVLMVYNPPRDNEPMENYLKKTRGRWGGYVVRTARAARHTLKFKHEGKPVVLWLAADQTALASSPYWISFLNREAAFFAGPVQLAKKTNHPVFFQHIKKPARGKYEIVFTKLFDEPAQLDANEILSIYVQKMEEVIKNEPEYYLWSHKRWKHTRPANITLLG